MIFSLGKAIDVMLSDKGKRYDKRMYRVTWNGETYHFAAPSNIPQTKSAKMWFHTCDSKLFLVSYPKEEPFREDFLWWSYLGTTKRNSSMHVMPVFPAMRGLY